MRVEFDAQYLALVCRPRWLEISHADTGLSAYEYTVLADFGRYAGRRGLAGSGIDCESSREYHEACGRRSAEEIRIC
jgi:hypothetical protein